MHIFYKILSVQFLNNLPYAGTKRSGIPKRLVSGILALMLSSASRHTKRRVNKKQWLKTEKVRRNMENNYYKDME